MKRLFLVLLFIVFVAQQCLGAGALDPSIDNKHTWKNAYRFTGKPKDLFLDWCVLVEDRLDGTVGIDFVYLVPATAPATAAKGQLYFDLATSNLKYYTTSWQTVAASTSSTLDEAYDGGTGITVDAGAVTLTTAAASDSAALAIVHGETGNFAGVTISNASAYPAVQFTTTGAGADVTGTSATWSISKAGAITCVGVDTTSTITLANDETILNDTNDEIQFGNGTDDISFGFGTADTLTLTSDTSVATIAFGDLDAFTGVASITGDAGADFALATTNTGTYNFTIAQSGVGDNELRLTSAGTAANAIALTTTTGGMTFTSVNDFIVTCSSATTGDDISITQTGAQDASILLTAAGTGADAIGLTTTAGGIVVQSAGASKDIKIDATAGSIIIDGGESAGDSVIIQATGAAGGVELICGTGDITLDSGDDIFLSADTGAGDVISLSVVKGTSDASIVIASTVGGIDMDSALSTHITSSEETGDAIYLHASGAAGGVDITSGTGDIVLTSTDDIVLTNATAAGDMIQLLNTAGTSVTEDSGAIQITATAGGIIIQSDANLADCIQIRADGGTTAEMLIHNDQGTAEDSIQIISDAGGIDISAATAKNITVTGGQFTVLSNEDVASAISLTTNTGTSETIVITNTLGTAAGAITLAASAGGVTIGAVGAENGDVAISAGDNITITSTGSTTIANTEAFTVNGSTTLTGAVTCTAGIQMGAISREPTADGGTTGTIATGTSFVTIVDPTQATDWITLPSPVAGTIIWLGTVDDASGFEIRTSDPATISLNGVTGANKESAVPATASLVRLVCVSSNDWIGTMWDASGTEAELPVPDV